jgi:hypothetical protein
VEDPTVVALRSKVLPVVTPGIDPAQVDVTIILKDGRTLHRFISHAIGSIEVPMTDQQLEDKFADLADGVIPDSAIRRVIDACWNVETLTEAAEIAKNIGLCMTAIGAPAADSQSDNRVVRCASNGAFRSGSKAGIGPVLSPRPMTSSAEAP